MKDFYLPKFITRVRQLVILIGLLLGSLYTRAQAPDFAWAQQPQGKIFNTPEEANRIAVDASGNSYVAGYFQGSISFGSITLTSISGSNDIFVAKYDAAGNVLWATRAGGDGNNDEVNGIAVDNSGNSYITGDFIGNATFGSITLTNSGHRKVYLAKYDGAGNLLWAKQTGGTSNSGDIANGLAVDGSGNSYITGYFSGSSTFGSIMLTSSASSDVFVAKYDAAGNALWAQQAGGTQSDNAQSIAVDGSGNSYITGYFAGSATFGNITFTSSAPNNIFVVKYDATGNLLWAKQAGGDVAQSIAVDGSGNSFITGYFSGSSTFGSIMLTSNGSRDAFLAKYDAAGNVLWAKQAGGTNTEEASGIAVDASGNSYITGYFIGSTAFNNTTLTSNGDRDAFLAKYDAVGNVLWAKQAGGTNTEEANGIAVDGSGNSYITGYFSGSATFGSTTLTSNGSSDAFLAKYDAAGNVLWANNPVGFSANDLGKAIAVDAIGNSYVVGTFTGRITFGSTTLTSSVPYNIFVAKFDVTGNILWAVQAGGTYVIEPRSIAIDGNGNSYITGHFGESATFGSTTLISTNGSQDIFLAKYDAAGNVLWAKQAGGTNSETPNGIAVDGSGNSHITGYFSGSTTFGNTTLSSSGSSDVFLAKYDASGNVLWANQAGGTNSEAAQSIAVDGSGNSYITGFFSGSAAFSSTTLTSNGSRDAFLAKYDAAGNLLWAKQAGGTNTEEANGIAVDGSGNSYITGYFGGNSIFGSTTLTSSVGQDAFIAKFDVAGNVLWAKQSSGNGNEFANSIAVDGSGNSHLTGYFTGSTTFGSTPLTSNGSFEIFVTKYDVAGHVLWEKQAGGINDDRANSIAVDGNGNSYITGHFRGSATYGNNTLITGGTEVFIAKINASNINTQAINPSNYCPGETVSVPFTIAGPSFASNNIFTAQLSDATGSFTSPTNIGTLNGSTDGTINATLPANTPPSTGYRIRVVSSSPAIMGSDNGSNLTVNALQTFYADADNDGFGNASQTTQACSAPSGYVTDNTDCDDTDNTIYQGAPELCDGKDHNCDGVILAAPTAIFAVNDVSCTGSSDGSITINATGVSPFQYSINNGSYGTVNVFGSLPAGTYTIKVKSAEGCEFEAQNIEIGTIPDVTNPTIGTLTNITVSNTAGGSSAIVTFNLPVSDNCLGVTVTSNPLSGASFPVGTTTVNVEATDAAGNKANGSFTVTVNDTQVPPELASIGNKTVNELTLLNFTATATDPNLPQVALTYSLSGAIPAGAAINPSTGVLNWTPTEAQGPNTYSFTVEVSDGTFTDSELITVTVNEVNQAPVLAAIGNKTINVNSNLAFTISGSDADLPAQSLTYSMSNAPANATLNSSTGSFSWTPQQSDVGTHNITFRVTDSGGGIP